MHALTAWDLKFQVSLGYTFTSATLNELDLCCEWDRYEPFWYSWLSVNVLDTSCEWDRHELWGTRIEVHAQLRIPLKSSFTSGVKLEMRKNGLGIWQRFQPQDIFWDFNTRKIGKNANISTTIEAWNTILADFESLEF